MDIAKMVIVKLVVVVIFRVVIVRMKIQWIDCLHGSHQAGQWHRAEKSVLPGHCRVCQRHWEVCSVWLGWECRTELCKRE
jgi:hypothetical protein